MKKLQKRCSGFMMIFALALVFSAPLFAAESSSADKWKFDASLYGWGASMGGQTATGTNVDVDFNDLLNNLELAFMGAFGAHKGKWSFLADVIYLDVSESATISGVPVKVELESWIVTPFVAYTVYGTERWDLGLLGGARYLYMNPDLSIGPYRSSKSESIWDGIIGVRGNINLSEKWYLPYHLDLGAGESDFTWQALLGIGYHFSRIDLSAGYRYLKWDFGSDKVIKEMDISGPFAGLRIRF